MADLHVLSTAPIALAAATTKTVVAIHADATKPCQIRNIAVSFDGATAANEPVLVEWYYLDSAGTPGAYGGEWAAPMQDLPGVNRSWGYNVDYSAEPTQDGVVFRWFVTPNGGLLTLPFYGTDAHTITPGASFGLRCTAPDAVNVVASISVWE